MIEDKQYDALIQEYQLLRGEIDGYFKARITILTIMVSAIGIILGFTKEIEHNHQVLSLFVITLIGAQLTFTFTSMARQKSAYIKVFIEDKIEDLNWFSIPINGLELIPDFARVIFKKLNFSSDYYPQEYSSIYLILGLIINVYSIPLIETGLKDTLLYIVVIGDILILQSVISIQYAISQNRFKTLVKYYQSKYLNK